MMVVASTARRLVAPFALVVLAVSVVSLLLRHTDVQSSRLVAASVLAPFGIIVGAVVSALALRGSSLQSRVAVVVAPVLLLMVGTGTNPARLLCLPGFAGESGPIAGFTVYSHNVQWAEGSPELVAAQISRATADVVLLQEADRAFVADLRGRLGDRYQHVLQADAGQTLSLAILSRWPLVDTIDTSPARDQNPFLVATVESPERALRVANVHLSAPRGAELMDRWRAEYRTLTSGVFRADIVGGDFNGSRAHKPFQTLLDSGYADAHAEAGCGTGTTWTGLGFGPSLLHLDHVLVGEQWNVLGYRTVGRAGSDHTAVVATVAPRPEA